MSKEKFKLLTVICEPVLTNSILKMARSIGATGFTLTDVKGEGSGEKSSGEVPNEKNKIEVVVDSIIAKKLMHDLAEAYFKDYSIILYVADIEVIRTDKF